ncbi:MAG: hypothetical protein CMN32_15170 [Saprospirales bacterium]|nr:hypothetical protein [Saprospirales bacterium]
MEIRDFLERLFSWWRSEDKEKSVSSVDSVAIYNNDVKDGIDSRKQIDVLALTSDLGSSSILDMPDELKSMHKELVSNSWILGNSDGRLGQRQMTSEFFMSLARQLRMKMLYFLKGKLEASTAKLNEARELMDAAARRLTHASKLKSKMEKRKELHPGRFSILLMLFYLITATLILLADIPLGLMVTQYIFDVAPTDLDHDITKLFVLHSNEPSCSGYLYDHVLNVIFGNWQVFLMTIGVALSAVYVKVFYDELMGHPVDKEVRQFRMMAKFEADTDESIIKNELNRMKRWHYVRLAVSVILFSFTVYTIYVLGEVRSATEETIKSQASISIDENIKSLDEDSSQAISENPRGDVALTDDGHKKLATSSNWMFILISLLFPIIAGVCFSLGINVWHNLRLKHFAKQRFNKCQKDYSNRSNDFSKAQALFANCQYLVSQCEDEKFLDDQSILLHHTYLHGYQRGVEEADDGLSEVQVVEKYFNKFLSSEGKSASRDKRDLMHTFYPILNGKG